MGEGPCVVVVLSDWNCGTPLDLGVCMKKSTEDDGMPAGCGESQSIPWPYAAMLRAVHHVKANNSKSISYPTRQW